MINGVKSTRLMSDDIHQSPHPFFTAWAKRRRDLVIADACGKRVIRHLQLAGINSKARKRAAGTQGSQTILKGLLRSSASIATSAPPAVNFLISANTSCSL